MSYIDTKKALIQQLYTSGISPNDIAFENKNFDPSGKTLWYAAYFIPATTEDLGKTPNSADESRGIFQVSVFIELNSVTFDDDQLTAIDNVLSVFKYNTQTVYNSQTVNISNSTVNNGVETEAWFQRDISVNYFTFTNRG